MQLGRGRDGDEQSDAYDRKAAAEFEDLVLEVVRKRGMSRSEASTLVRQRRPELYRQMND